VNSHEIGSFLLARTINRGAARLILSLRSFYCINENDNSSSAATRRIFGFWRLKTREIVENTQKLTA